MCRWLSHFVPYADSRLGVIFFFQAEDGIRGLTVTGVQTCALPICLGRERDDRHPPQRRILADDLHGLVAVHLRHHDIHRSEERRVGKECRSRWLWEHLKKNWACALWS